MWGKQVYYTIKPLIPRRVQIGLRRIVARSVLRNSGAIWPIDEKCATPPIGWTGWPNGKQFALVLTHDVDTRRGQDRCQDLIALEERLGFRSSFNFVPLRYAVSPGLRANLTNGGFEVGVHGLYHDGKYYTSRKIFLERAARINYFLKSWDAVGYRAPSMLHKLDWFHEFNIEYDASTFDTDPFEPNAEGAGTIFPFWIPGERAHKGYVELPYTLAQDFSLFVLLKQDSILIWKQKLDWIAKNKGMVLLNTHPDYMHFNGGKPGYEEYPARHYEEFLLYIKKAYQGRYWHALPREAARFWRRHYCASGKSGKRQHEGVSRRDSLLRSE
jgi:hypothetical protein